MMGNLESMPAELRDRLDLVKEAGYQVEALVRMMRRPIAQMVMSETHDQEVALSLILDRLTVLANTIAVLGDELSDVPQEDLQARIALSASTMPDEEGPATD